MYAIYAKPVGEKRFKPIDLQYGSLVDRLIYASVFFDYEVDKAERIIKHLRKCNETTAFELRRISLPNVSENVKEMYRSQMH